MRIVKRVIIIGMLVFFLQGASCPPKDTGVPRTSPEETLRIIKTSLEESNYATAYHCLTKDTRNRYPFSHFKMMFEWTMFGVLIKDVIVTWRVKDVKYFTETVTTPSKLPPEPQKGVGTGSKPSENSAVSPDEAKIPSARIIQKAKVLMEHWKYPTQYQKEFIFVYEDNGWRIDFTLAGVLGLPQEDEDVYYK
ncbi:MAG: hypothetical protein QME51_06660 [Planctomycetota bacterium]|nr:hypothetical protein [Planctomycetota bacterium]MDI6788034.1 hypothetical protein [Planctomycetota bacterium]